MCSCLISNLFRPTYGLKFGGKYGVSYERQNIPIDERFYAFFKEQYEAATDKDIVLNVTVSRL